MMYRGVLQKSVTVSGVSECDHISHVSTDRVWISDNKGNLILTNTRGEELNRVTYIASVLGGHTVDSNGDLIYIDSRFNIIKLSTDNKDKTTIIKYSNTAPWRPQCVYSSPSTGDLLVAMYRYETDTVGKVVRYNSTGENIQTIQHNNITGQGLYRYPRYITENRNGDVIVSDSLRRAVVVTDCDGKYWFSYTGPPSGSGQLPLGICTDALSHILVCDVITQSVHMLDSDGHYLTEILTVQHGIDLPRGLSYDDDTHLLWVGSLKNNTVNIYRVVDTDSLTGLPLEDINCKTHPRIPLDQFCTLCGVPLCVECASSKDHSRHQLRNIKTLFNNIHEIEDGDTLLMCLLLSNSYKINMKDGNWMTKCNAVAKSFHSKEITKPFAPTDLEEYKPFLKHNESEIGFSIEVFRHLSFLNFSNRFGLNFTDIFFTWAEKENIAKYCRSWNYRRGEDEVCCWLLPEKNEEFLERLGEDIFTHPTMEDRSFHEAVFKKFGIPMQIILRGDKSVTNFIENLKKGKTTMYHASGMIVGCAGSGKTTLLERLKGIDLEKIKKNISSTRGVDIHTDVFDVTDNIQANSSKQQQRFKLKFDKNYLHQSVPDYHSENVADDEETQETMETPDDESHVIHASNSGQISRDDTNIKTTSFSPQQGAISTSNLAEATKENKDIVGPNNPGISGNLQINAKNIPEYPDKKITMTDFAGQCSYYASHQIFLSPRAFFILVLNMEKKFDDQVGEEVCCQEGSIYERWTHRDYLEFWLKSIHQYSNDKAPVLLIGTHSEKKTEKEIMSFFHEIWATLEMKDKTLHRHLHEDRQFAVGFHDNESIENIKLSIVKVVQNLNHWGEKLPLSWVMFEKFFQEKKSQRIMKKEMLLAFNDALPTGIKLETVNDINIMLQFFHDIREILYFNQELLNVVIILDVQWFANLFKNVITDRNHAEKDLCRFASDWKKFDQTGELNDTLLTAIWEMKGIAFSEHKTNVMLYMEKLGLLAKLDDKKWYVPCMNKMPCPDNLFSSCPTSSIFCYVFDVLPVGIFHRLVATCLQIPWEIVTERGRLCIYQTAAVFLFKGQNILLGMTPREIQLQVFVIEGRVEMSKCQEIKAEIDRMLNVLSRTFQTDFRFTFGFKCKASGFCDSQESSVINESEFTKAIFQCPSCPIGRKHIINSKNITKYWVQVYHDEVEPSEVKGIPNSSPLESVGPSESHPKDNLAKIVKLLQVGTDAVRICFDKFLPKEELEKTLKANETDMRRGQFRFQQPQLEILFPPQGGSNTCVSSLSMDVSIMYKLLRNYSDIASPGNGWGKEPRIVDITDSDDIERIRLYRNKYSHDPGSSPVMSDSVFNIIWDDLSKAILRLSGDVLKRRISEI